MYQIGVDIGGTNIKVGLVSETLELLQSCSVRFPHDGARSVVKTIEEAVNFLLQQQNIPRGQLESVGIVVPGSIDQTGERVIDAYNLGFHDVPLKALVQEAFEGVPVYLANDPNGAALAELYAGAFRGCKTAVLLTLGTGLGGGIIFGGHMFNGGMNQGVELGHMYLVNGGEHCTCGNDGCMEAYCAASALARDGKRAMLEHPESLMPNAPLERITDGEQLFRKIIEPYKGKVIYLDIWGTWCGPCKDMMQYAGNIKNLFAGKEVVFLYLCNHSTDKSWKNIIKEYGLTSKSSVHYNLPDKQQSAIEKYLGVHSFPTYMLIDKEGNIVNRKAPRPTMENQLLNAVYKELEK